MIAATNRPDTLDPALLRSGRLGDVNDDHDEEDVHDSDYNDDDEEEDVHDSDDNVFSTTITL